MMNTWAPIHGKPLKKPAKSSHAITRLKLSNGGILTSVPPTKMSRGRAKDARFSPTTTFTTTAGSTGGFHRNRNRTRSPSPNRGNNVRDWYLEGCEVQKKEKQSLYSRIGADIGIERIAKFCMHFAEKEPLLKPLIPHVCIPKAKSLTSYLLGNRTHEFALQLRELKNTLIEQRELLQLTKDHFNLIEKMFEKAIFQFCSNSEMRLEWQASADCFRREVEKGCLFDVATAEQKKKNLQVDFVTADSQPLGNRRVE